MRQALSAINGASTGDVLAGVAAGFIGGLAGAFVMNQVSPALQKVKTFSTDATEAEGSGRGSTQDDGGDENANGSRSSDSMSATVEVAQKLSRAATGHGIPRDVERTAGNIVHFAFGGLNGAFYGGVAALAPGVMAGRGLVFGASLWAVADEVMLPLLRLSKAPTRYPISTHAMALTNHLAYGLTLEAVRWVLRRSSR